MRAELRMGDDLLYGQIPAVYVVRSQYPVVYRTQALSETELYLDDQQQYIMTTYKHVTVA